MSRESAPLSTVHDEDSENGDYNQQTTVRSGQVKTSPDSDAEMEPITPRTKASRAKAYAAPAS
jgi:hypothetical protein